MWSADPRTRARAGHRRRSTARIPSATSWRCCCPCSSSSCWPCRSASGCSPGRARPPTPAALARRCRRRAPPLALARRSPRRARPGGPGVGDPYFPDYGSSGYDAVRYQIAVNWDPGSQFAHRSTTRSPPAPRQPPRVLLRRPGAGGHDGPGQRPAGDAGQEDFQDLRITPARADRGRRGLRGDHRLPRRTRPRCCATTKRPGGPPTPSGPRPGPASKLGVVVPGQRPPLRSGPDGRLRTGSGRHGGDQRRPTGVARHRQRGRLRHLALGGAAADGDLPELRQHRAVPARRRASSTAGRTCTRSPSSSTRRPGSRSLTTAAPVRTRWCAGSRACSGRTPSPSSAGSSSRTSWTSPVWRPRPARCTTRESIRERDFATDLIVHELAHMWFGDQVTVRQWNDIFLNEGYASWAQWGYAERGGGTPERQPATQRRLRADTGTTASSGR